MPPTNAILDNFNRANASTLGASWGDGINSGWTSFGIVSNTAQNAAQWKSNYWLAQFAADQEVFCTLATAAVPRIYARLQTLGAAPKGYYIYGSTASNQIFLASITGGQLGAAISQALAVGDGLWMTVIGSEIKAYHRAGAGGTWTLVGTRTDTGVTGAGYIGVDAPEALTYAIDDFGGGAIGAGTDPAQNANVTITVGNRFRLRTELQETGGAAVATAYKLQVSKNGGAYADVATASGDVRVVDSPHFAHGDATTNLLTAGTGTFVAGQGLDTGGTSGSISLGANGHTELEWSLILFSGAAGNTFDFRAVRSDGTPLNAYTVTPRVTAA